MKILNLTKNSVITKEARIADTMIGRMTGLLNKKFLRPDEALVITRCQSIHMFFMRFAIDVIFVDKNDRAVGLVKNIRPFRLSPIFFKASYAIELPVGGIENSHTEIGDQLEIREN